jgi:phosphatase NudJ
MDRSGLHLTVAAIVHFQNQFLFVEERDKISGKLVYNQPAGHVEAKEDLFAAVCRELYEETGLSLTPTAWLGISQLHAANGEFYFRVNFVFELDKAPPPHQPQDSDILALHWLSAEQLQDKPVRSRLVLDAIQSYQTGKRLDLALIQPMVDMFSAN